MRWEKYSISEGIPTLSVVLADCSLLTMILVITVLIRKYRAYQFQELLFSLFSFPSRPQEMVFSVPRFGCDGPLLPFAPSALPFYYFSCAVTYQDLSFFRLRQLFPLTYDPTVAFPLRYSYHPVVFAYSVYVLSVYSPYAI